MGCFSNSRNKSTDPEDDRVQRETNRRIDQQLQKDKQLYRATHRLLLLGKVIQRLLNTSFVLNSPGTYRKKAVIRAYKQI